MGFRVGLVWCRVVTQKLTHFDSFIHSLYPLIHSLTRPLTHFTHSLISTTYSLTHSLSPFTNLQLTRSFILLTLLLHSLTGPPTFYSLKFSKGTNNVYTLFGLLRWHLVNASAYSLSVDLNVPRFSGLKYGYFSLWKLRWLIKFRGSMLMFGRAGSTWPPSFRFVWTTTCLQEFTITAQMCLYCQTVSATNNENVLWYFIAFISTRESIRRNLPPMSQYEHFYHSIIKYYHLE